jgi:HSP20 family protein
MSLIRYTRNDPFFNVFEEFFPTVSRRTTPRTTQDQSVRVRDLEGQTQISVAAPGLSKDSFQISLNEEVLAVTYSAQETDDTYFVKDSFSRSWRVARGTTSEDVSAAYEDGILTVSVSKPIATEASTFSIPVN